MTLQNALNSLKIQFQRSHCISHVYQLPLHENNESPNGKIAQKKLFSLSGFMREITEIAIKLVDNESENAQSLNRHKKQKLSLSGLKTLLLFSHFGFSVVNLLTFIWLFHFIRSCMFENWLSQRREKGKSSKLD